MAIYYQEAGDFKRAKQYMDAALDREPEDLRTRLVAARWCLQTALREGQLDQAREHAAKAVVLDDKSLEAKILRGAVALYQKDYGTAERQFLAAHVLSPSNFAASNNLALALCEQKDESKRRRALEYATNNAQQYDKSAEALSTYGWVLYKNNDSARADQVLSQLVRTRVGEDTLYYAARVATDRRRPDVAIKLLERALSDKERPFSMRSEAEELLAQLNRTSGGR
jgi:Tfp pilus assembly protein PilF